MSDEEYKEKYLKYKNKYNNLKKIIELEHFDDFNMEGGGLIDFFQGLIYKLFGSKDTQAEESKTLQKPIRQNKPIRQIKPIGQFMQSQPDEEDTSQLSSNQYIDDWGRPQQNSSFEQEVQKQKNNTPPIKEIEEINNIAYKIKLIIQKHYDLLEEIVLGQSKDNDFKKYDINIKNIIDKLQKERKVEKNELKLNTITLKINDYLKIQIKFNELYENFKQTHQIINKVSISDLINSTNNNVLLKIKSVLEEQIRNIYNSIDKYYDIIKTLENKLNNIHSKNSELSLKKQSDLEKIEKNVRLMEIINYEIKIYTILYNIYISNDQLYSSESIDSNYYKNISQKESLIISYIKIDNLQYKDIQDDLEKY